MTYDTILAAGGGLGEYVWVIAVLILTLVSWVAGKIKERSQRSQGPQRPPGQRRTARTGQEASEDDEPIVVDLAELLGMGEGKQKPPARPRPIPVATPTARVVRPAAPPAAPQPEPRKVEPAEPVAEVVACDREPDDSVHVFPGDLTSAAVRSRTTAGRRRLGALTRHEMRRGVILSEILGKPVALRDSGE
jgi:hypothetical protein